MRACRAEVYLEGIGLYDAGLDVFSSVVHSLAGGAEYASEKGGTKPLGEVEEDAKTSAEGVNSIEDVRSFGENIDMDGDVTDNFELGGVK